MKRLFPVLTIVAMAMFAWAPVMIVQAPYESTMGLVQKIFYFHFPSWIAMFTAAFVCGIAGAVYLFTTRASADRVTVAAAELAVVFGIIGLITGPLWGRKAWGVWWQWDARLTSALARDRSLHRARSVSICATEKPRSRARRMKRSVWMSLSPYTR